MKVRFGFVTNSSSSSYLIAIPKSMRLYDLLVLDELPDYEEGMWSDGSHFKEEIDTKESLISCWLYGYGDNHDLSEGDRELLERVLEVIVDGGRVYKINISYHNDDSGIQDRISEFLRVFPDIILDDHN